MKNQILALLRPVRLPFWWQDLMLVFPRVVTGYLLTHDFGGSKFGLPWSPAENKLGFFQVASWFPEDVATYGGLFALFPVFFAWMGAFSEAVGGIFLLFGLFTRPFALLIGITMLVAVFCQQWDQGTWNLLPALGIFWTSLFYLVLGSGRFGVDNFLSSKKS